MTFDLQADYEPGLSRKSDYDPLSHDDFNSFTLMELEALKEYAKDLDMTRACNAAGYVNGSAQAARMLAKDKFRAELKIIHDIWRTNLAMTAEHASARHIKLMNKFEKEYDNLPSMTSKGDSTIKGQLVGTLGKMSADYLKAAGQMDGASGQDAQVVINIHSPDVEVEVTKKKRKPKTKEDPDLIDITPEEDNELEDMLS